MAPEPGDFPAREMLEDPSQDKTPRQRDDDEGKPDGQMFAKVGHYPEQRKDHDLCDDRQHVADDHICHAFQ